LAEIEKNLQVIKGEFSSPNILILDQVHGNIVVDADELNDFHANPTADAAITTKGGLVLAVQTADCVPVLVASTDGKVIGAAHCGWKGTKSEIIAELAKKMKEKGAKSIKALIGPSIQQYSYEIDQKYYEDFISQKHDYNQFFIPSKNPGHHMFDLPGLVKLKLEEAGITEIEISSEDTYSLPDKYPSRRRDYHQGREYSKHILSALVIK